MRTKRDGLLPIAKILSEISDPAEMRALLSVLLTQSELREIVNRVRIIEMLAQGTPHREIAANVGVGIATVSRGASAYKNASESVLKRLTHMSD